MGNQDSARRCPGVCYTGLSVFDIERIRQEFPITEEGLYLNHASVGPIPRRAQQAMEELNAEHLRISLTLYEQWHVRYRQVREQAARLLHTTADHIAFIKNTSEGLSFASNGIDWRDGDNVVLPEIAFPSTFYAWKPLADRGVEMRLVPAQGKRIRVDDIRALINDRTRAISVDSVHFDSGFRHDLAAIAELCRAHDLLFVVDGIQGVGALDLDVQACGIDLMSASAHKWLMGPLGIGILYCSERALERLKVNMVGWRSVRNPHQYDAYQFELVPTAQRFEAGTENSVGIYGLGGTLDLIHEIGINTIETRVLGLCEFLCAGLQRKGYEIVTPRGAGECSGIVVFTTGTPDSNEALYTRLTDAQAHVSPRGDGIRVSPHYYNTEDELEQFLEILP